MALYEHVHYWTCRESTKQEKASSTNCKEYKFNYDNQQLRHVPSRMQWRTMDASHFLRPWPDK
jgi:hypothetical protein